MSAQDNFLSELLKKPSFTLGVTVLAGFGLGLLYERNKAKIQQLKNKVSSETPPSKRESSNKEQSTPQNKYGELPKEYIVSVGELETVMRQYLTYIQEKKSIEEIVPREFLTDNDLRRVWCSLEYVGNESDLISTTKGFSEPLWDLLDRGGKRWRPILCFFIAQSFGKNIDEVIHVASIIELIHSGFIMATDIMEQNEIRRGKPPIHLVHGADITTNTSSFLYFVPWLSLLRACEGKLPKEKILRLMRFYIQEMTNIHIGVAWSIHWHNCDKIAHIPTEEQYLQMENHKAGVLARLAAKFVGEILDLPREVQRALGRFNERVGIAFQIHNDVLDVLSDGKGETISKGKMSMIIVHSLNHGTFDDRERLIDILKMKTNERSYIEEAIGLLNKSDSVNYARNKAGSLIQEAWDGVKDYIPNNKFKGCLKTFAETFPANLV